MRKCDVIGLDTHVLLRASLNTLVVGRQDGCVVLHCGLLLLNSFDCLGTLIGILGDLVLACLYLIQSVLNRVEEVTIDLAFSLCTLHHVEQVARCDEIHHYVAEFVDRTHGVVARFRRHHLQLLLFLHNPVLLTVLIQVAGC